MVHRRSAVRMSVKLVSGLGRSEGSVAAAGAEPGVGLWKLGGRGTEPMPAGAMQTGCSGTRELYVTPL